MYDNHLINRLLGVNLEGGWKITEKVNPSENATGGNFSVGYIAENTLRKKAFVKVLDVTKAFSHPDPAQSLQALTQAFNYERDVISQCVSMSNVVSALGEGVYQEGKEASFDNIAQYIVFELAKQDLRHSLHFSSGFDIALKFRTMHNIAKGLAQLHSKEIAHQDIKPSNIFAFGNNIFKVGDLGRSSQNHSLSPHDNLGIAGDKNYAPPEQLYNDFHSDWKIRRFGTDFYQLGSMLVYTLIGTSMTTILSNFIDTEHHYSNWNRSYRDVLPYVLEYFRETVERIRESLPKKYTGEIENIIVELCHPDPLQRGHPRNRAIGNQYGLDRYISSFNRLAFRFETELRAILR